MGDEEKKRLLQALIAAAQGTAEQLGLPKLDSPTLQMGNSLYSLSASGHLEARHCKQQPRLLSAQVVQSHHAALDRSTDSQQAAQHSSRLELVILAANTSAGDQVRLHFLEDSQTVTVDAEFDESAPAGQAVQLSIAVPPDAKPVVAVELLRDSFASQKVGVNWSAADREHALSEMGKASSGARHLQEPS